MSYYSIKIYHKEMIDSFKKENLKDRSRRYVRRSKAKKGKSQKHS